MSEKTKNIPESKDSDETSSGRVRRAGRYAKVTGTAVGLAARVAGERYLGLKIEREAHAQ